MEHITALDTEIMNLVQPIEPTETTVEQPVTPTEPVKTEPEPTPTPSTPPISEIEIEGLGKVKIDDIKEWQKGNMRQSDYTKKTQEIARQREELQDAIEVFNYLKANPGLVAKLKEIDQSGLNTKIVDKASPDNELLRTVYMNQEAMKLDAEVNRLKGVYGEVDEVTLFNRARELGMNVDNIEVLYKSMAFDNNKPQAIDTNALMAQMKEQLMAELQQNRTVTQTIISQPSAPITTTPVELTPEEKKVADGMRVSYEDYAKWKNR
jgi:DNA-binding transcriptional MerR regulator